MLEEIRRRGDFERVHTCPSSYSEVPDEREACLVILGPEPHVANSDDSPALEEAEEILKQRSGGPRNYPNTLVFLATDQARLGDLDGAVRQWLAWGSIKKEREVLNLDGFQRNQVDQKLEAAGEAIEARIPESYIWVLVKEQRDAQKQEFQWQKMRATSNGELAKRVSKKLVDQGLLMTECAGVLLRQDLDKVPLWDGDHVKLEQLADYYAKYLYLPRLKNANVLVRAVEQGAGLLTWKEETFGYADAYDEAKQRYLGLRGGQNVGAILNKDSLVVKPDVAARQLEADAVKRTVPGATAGESDAGAGVAVVDETGETAVDDKEVRPPKLSRFHGSVSLDPARVARDASTINQEVIQHLVGRGTAQPLSS